MKIALPDKQRVLNAAQNGDDWRAVAVVLGINYKTVWQWVSLAEEADTWIASPSKRGGARYNKMTFSMKTYLSTRMDENCHLTLGEMADTLQEKFAISMRAQTIKNAVDGLGYTIKEAHKQSDKMNTAANKTKRLDYQIAFVEHQAMARRAPKGQRLSKTVTASKGANIHVMACISSTGLTYWERLFGSNNADTSNEFLRQLLNKIAEDEPLENIVLVLDNAPYHARAELVFGEVAFSHATLLRLGLYSQLLNPIESVFSTLKSHMKKYLTLHCRAVLRPPRPGVTIKDYRVSYLAQAADLLVEEAVTVELCFACVRHTSAFHRDVLSLNDMPVGE